MADVADLVNLRVDVGTLKQAVADQKQELQSLAQEFRSLRKQVWGLMGTTFLGPLLAGLVYHRLF